MGSTSKVVSYEEWVEMPVTEDAKEEVVGGEIVIMPPNKWNHARIVHRLQKILERSLNPDNVWALSTGFGLVIRKEPLTCRTPDLAVFIAGNVVEVDGYVHSPPELVVEVLSPSNTRAEMAARIRDYESISVPELWILSPEAHTFEVLHLQDGKLRTAQVMIEGELRPRLFPETSVDVASVWPH